MPEPLFGRDCNMIAERYPHVFAEVHCVKDVKRVNNRVSLIWEYM